jgi:hypothetical protein
MTEALTEITVTFSDEIKANSITPDDQFGLYTAGSAFPSAFGNWSINGNVLTITLTSTLTTAGTYTLRIPADYIVRKSDGMKMEQNANIEFKVGVPAPLNFVSITPETTECLEVIEVTFSEEIVSNYAEGDKVNLRKGNDKIAITNIVADGCVLRLTLDEPLTVAGTYGITISKGKVSSKATGVAYGGGNFSIVITATDGIDGIDAEERNDVIYDLTGRKIETITKAGIYIINGKKVLVK